MRLLLEERLKMLRGHPSSRLREIGVRERMHVADLGAGKGLYSLVAASVVGPDGVVYAVEPDSSRAAVIERRASAEGLGNVRVLPTGAEDMSGIPESTVDVAFSLNSLHHFGDKAAVFAEVRRVLKTGGSFYVRDILRNRLMRHGTSREEISHLPAAGFQGKRVRVARLTMEATFTR